MNNIARHSFIAVVAAALLLAACGNKTAGQQESENIVQEPEFPIEYFDKAGNIAHESYNVWDEIVRVLPGQGLSIKAPGVRQIIAISPDSPGEYKVIWDFYPNGLRKSKIRYDEDNDKVNAYNSYDYKYDSQWRLQSIVDKEGKVVSTYTYDKEGKLISSNHDYKGECKYIYDNAGNLTRIDCGDNMTLTIKNNKVVCLQYNTEGNFPIYATYDEKGRWTGEKSILPDGMDEVFYFKQEHKVNYDKDAMPVSRTWSSVEYDPEKKEEIGETDVYTTIYTYTYDDKGNWTSWTGKEGDTEWTIKRTITYYTDQEVEEALEAMKKARDAAGKGQ